jgi:predicted RNA methylase
MIGQNYYDAYDYAINDILDNNKYDPSIVPEEITNGISTSEKYSRLYAQYIMSNNNFDLTIVPKIILDSIKSDQYQKDIFDGYLEDNNVKKTESLNISRLKTLSGIK